MKADGRPSGTAARVALRRAAHQVIDRPLVFDDPLAMKMIRWDAAEILRKNPVHFERGRYSSLMRAFLAVRSRIAEDVIAEEVAGGTTQVVILGAGLDTFAYRNTHSHVRVFEVDHPSTQTWKRKRLAESEIAIPSTVTYAPVDFERDKLLERLEAAGLDRSQPTIFSWLGVSMYLDESSVWATLRDIATCTQHGGGVIFDYSVPPGQLSWRVRFYLWLLQRRVKKAGEPFKCFFDPSALADGLRRIGFDRIDDLDGAAINARYFSERTDGLHVGVVGHVITARRMDS